MMMDNLDYHATLYSFKDRHVLFLQAKDTATEQTFL